MDKRVLVVAAAAVLVFIAFFSFKERGVASRVVEAISGVSSYRVSTEVYATTTGVLGGETVSYVDSVRAVGATDVSARKMVMSAAMEKTSASSEVPASSGSMVVYLVGDTLFVNANGNWSIQNAPPGYDAWSRYQLKQLGNIIADSKVSVVSEDEKSAVMELRPSKEKLVEYMRGQGPSSFGIGQFQGFEDALKDFKMNVSVDKRTMLPSEFRMSGLVEAGGMSRATEIVMKLWDYNQRVEIALPDEVAGVATSAS